MGMSYAHLGFTDAQTAELRAAKIHDLDRLLTHSADSLKSAGVSAGTIKRAEDSLGERFLTLRGGQPKKTTTEKGS